LSGRVAVVTGASAGLGEAIARRLSAEGWRVALAARSADRLKEIAADLDADSGRSLVIPGDVTIAEDRQRLVDTVIEQWGRIDVLVNNAGRGQYGDVHEMPFEDVRRLFETNVLSLIDLTQLVLPHMLERDGGHIVNMGSMAGHVAAPPLTVYASTKHAVVGFTRSLHRELRGTGVHATVVCPGPARTAFGKVASGKDVDPDRVPGGVTAERVARAVSGVLRRPRRMVVVPYWQRAGIVTERLLPWVLDAYTAGIAWWWQRNIDRTE
jgi:uncharacterized protein